MFSLVCFVGWGLVKQKEIFCWSHDCKRWLGWVIWVLEGTFPKLHQNSLVSKSPLTSDRVDWPNKVATTKKTVFRKSASNPGTQEVSVEAMTKNTGKRPFMTSCDKKRGSQKERRSIRFGEVRLPPLTGLVCLEVGVQFCLLLTSP